jgi:hypothetical protein
VNEGVFDAETVAKMSGGRIIAAAVNYAPYIDRRRQELRSDTLYSELQAMAKLIQDIVSHEARTIQLTYQTSRP